MSGFFTCLPAHNLLEFLCIHTDKIAGHESEGFELLTAIPSVGGCIPEVVTQHFYQACLIFCGSKSKQPPAIHEGDLGSIQHRKIQTSFIH
jgi:hypothetical protein